MSELLPRGRFRLKAGVRLIANDVGGFVVQTCPLRAIRVNTSAMKLLQQAQAGVWVDEATLQGKTLLSFFDSLYRVHLLEWTPSKDVFQPFVTIVIPVFNRESSIGECLDSLFSLNYPPQKREIIVVDDGSEDRTCDVVERYDVHLIRRERNYGQSAARNAGVRAAKGEIIAFIDSDCVADPDWLRELLPYFQYAETALIGGYVASFYQESWLDRYEEVKSPLNMGKTVVIGDSPYTDFYVPTCNMLVRKNAYEEVGGLDEAWRVGEDVDLCWKLKKGGHRLIYVPEGKVLHRHRNRFWAGFLRRFDYGTSEAGLFSRHLEVRKRFPWQPTGMVFLALCCLGLVHKPTLFFGIAAGLLLLTSIFRKTQLDRQVQASVFSLREIVRAVLRNYKFLAYYLSYHLFRYYILPLALIVALFPWTTPIALAIIIYPTLVEYFSMQPRLLLPIFFFFYLMEQLAYQTGVVWGCIRSNDFSPYHFRFTIKQASANRKGGNANRWRAGITSMIQSPKLFGKRLCKKPSVSP